MSARFSQSYSKMPMFNRFFYKLCGVLWITLALLGCAATPKEDAAPVLQLKQIGSPFPELKGNTPVVWSKNLVHSGIGAAINQRIYEALNQRGMNGLRRYEETNVLEVSPRYQVVWFFKEGNMGGGDKQLFIHAIPRDDAQAVVTGQLAVLVLAIVDIQENRLVWRGIASSPQNEDAPAGSKVLNWVDEIVRNIPSSNA